MSKSARSARSGRNILLWVLSLMLVASMVCGLILSILGDRGQRAPTATPPAQPTVVWEQPTPTVEGPQPSPQPLATSAQ